MRAVGIVCEYNPFHRGHLYQISETRRRLGDDAAVLCVMSGDFVQRGEAAIFDKFTRAEAACRCGADLVAELPLPWCLSSAEGFAHGAVSLLAALGCDTLSFGSESGDLDALLKLAAFVSDPAVVSDIRARMDRDETLSFARARQLVAAEALGDRAALLSNPNDILAVEYLKAIGTMEPLPILRAGAGHDSRDGRELRSAMQLRELTERGEDPAPFIPESAMEVFRRERDAGRTRNREKLEIALLSRLYALRPEAFDTLPDAGGGAGRRLYKALREEDSLERAVTKASNKRYTAARMRRMLLSAALGLCADDTRGLPPYARLLALSGKGRDRLASLRGKASVPLLNRPGEVRRLGSRAERAFSLGAEGHALYRLQFVTIDDRNHSADWKKGAVLVQNR